MGKNTSIVSYKGQLVSSEEPLIPAGSRAFRYGDGLFESMYYRLSRIPLLDLHLERLRKSAAILKLNLPEILSSAYLMEEVSRMIPAAGLGDEGRIRLQVFRSNGGLYTPDGNDAGFLIEATAAAEGAFAMPHEGIRIGVYHDHIKPQNGLSNLKTANALLYVLASIFKKEQGLDDVFLLNQSGNPVEATASNLFIFKDKKLLTPALSVGCVEGVMRRWLLRNASELSNVVAEQPVSVTDLENADSIFLTNATSGIRAVREFNGKIYDCEPVCAIQRKAYKILFKTLAVPILIELHYLPCVRYFSLFFSHRMIIDDQERFERQSYRNRCYIAGANGRLPLIIPVKERGKASTIKEVLIDNATDWQRIHWQSIRSAYGKAAFFEHYAGGFHVFYQEPREYLFDFTYGLLQHCLKALKMHTEIMLLSESAETDLQDYKDKIHPKKENPDDVKLPRYYQAFEDRHGFLPNLSILDLLFNLGPGSAAYLRGLYDFTNKKPEPKR